MAKKRIKCPKCSSVLDVTFKDGEAVKHIACPVCQAKLKLNFGPAGGGGTPPPPQDEGDGDKTIVGGRRQLKYSLLFNGMKLPLDRGVNTIGRRAMTSNSKVQLPVLDMHMSRSHAIIKVEIDSYGNTYATLANYKNMNVTKVNGTPIGQDDVVKLNKGDLITIGQTTIIFEAE